MLTVMNLLRQLRYFLLIVLLSGTDLVYSQELNQGNILVVADLSRVDDIGFDVIFS